MADQVLPPVDAAAAEVRLGFTRSLYTPEAVEAAARAYADLARVEVTVGDHEVVAVLHEPDTRVPDLADHFANHALHETIVRARGEEVA